ncbi:D-alanyl-D-alanine carboxypeptidase [Salinibacterium sp. NSLL150]|uniref:D-alanyl-D-alanine carboxypeptidase n=1 Tax=unclassified Salinibacterium TaxID=2632331 RepID=UPI0018CFDBAB|nr:MULTISPECIES: D-alanyl-D-alanine carboxypeptidase [unclassified Salinibacterium]MBH0099781.1 D-alanyl-D-alanine carboxypeptidase [Salinibacterium sp. NSLL35]MBH0102535.1 D-alanyl-D-alanine carboxypeptidase [Salinibacterium sp. NSLL150]MBH0105295.1 D-alanyl-D-alanine carboxypeptidase [Salinibacterium sp. NSLL16]MBH0108055.1 D-alanyl-D-alanine carboxypeptidase [Salinibacterium sp. NSLL17]
MTDSASSEPKAPGGIRAFITQHPTASTVTVAAVVFVLLAVVAVFAGISVGSANSAVDVTPDEVTAEQRSQPDVTPGAIAVRTCSVDALATVATFPSLVGVVTDAATGDVLWGRSADKAASPAHIVTAMTAAAALQALGADTRISTKVIDGSSAGVIVLVGGGDPTLATTNASYYRDAPQISDLASQAMTRYEELHPGVPITEIVLDSTLWNTSDAWDSNWPERERTGGYHSYVTALMVNGDRADPTIAISPRGTDPVQSAGQAFAQAAGLPAVTFSNGAAVGSTVLAEVKSQPISVLVEQMLISGDDSLAESLARLVSKQQGLSGAASTLNQAIQSVLSDAGLDDAGSITITDGSGLSPKNQVPPLFVAQFMAAGTSGSGAIATALSMLPVGGESGDLYNRFEGDAAAASGHVAAKSGWTNQEHSLGGVLFAEDGTQLAFAFYSIGEGISTDARTALDNLVAGVYTCGSNLSNY